MGTLQNRKRKVTAFDALFKLFSEKDLQTMEETAQELEERKRNESETVAAPNEDAPTDTEPQAPTRAIIGESTMDFTGLIPEVPGTFPWNPEAPTCHCGKPAVRSNLCRDHWQSFVLRTSMKKVAQ